MTQSATFTKREASNVKTSHRRDNGLSASYTLLTMRHGTIEELCTLRLYATDARAYACLWVNDRHTGTHVSGSGYAGGYGYHRASAAAGSAIESAGITLEEAIDGRGDGAIKDALVAIGRALGSEDKEMRVCEAYA